MNNEFKTLDRYTEKLKGRYLNTLAAFKIFERFTRLSNIKIVGKKKAEENTQIFNDFIYFFSTTKEAARCYFFIELAKFFDTSRDSLTISKVIDYGEKNIGRFTKKDFLDYHEGREIMPMLLEQYKPLRLQDLKRIKQKLIKNRDAIGKLKTYRDKFLAHDDIKKTRVDINSKEIKTLLNIVKSTINLLCLRLDFASNSYVNFEERPIEELDGIIDNLKKYERYRLDEIDRKYK